MKNFYKSKKILITGGCGFIGSTLALRLQKMGANITVVDSMRPSQGGSFFNLQPILNKITVHVSDVRDKDSIEYLIKGKDIIFNMAGTLSHVESMTDPYTDLDINTKAQVNILEACRQFNPKVKVLFAGTRNQYGRAEYLPVDEKHPMIPTDTNGINKHAGEQYHLLYYRDFGIKTCSLRVSNTYGPRHQMKHHRQGVLNWFIRQIMDGTMIQIDGNGEQLRDINYVDDVVEAFLLAGASNKVWGEAYNLGGMPCSLKSFTEQAIKVNKKGKFKLIEQPEERKKVEIGDFAADINKIKKDLGWEPKVSLEMGLKKTFDYYRKNKRYYW